MPKPVLGRSLGALLEEQKATPSSSDRPKADPAPLGAGVSSLVRGNHASRAEPPSEPEAPPQPELRVPRWYLLLADILLVALAWLLAFKSGSKLSWPRELFCLVCVLFGGALGLAAIGPIRDTVELKEPGESKENPRDPVNDQLPLEVESPQKN